MILLVAHGLPEVKAQSIRCKFEVKFAGLRASSHRNREIATARRKYLRGMLLLAVKAPRTSSVAHLNKNIGVDWVGVEPLETQVPRGI
jgi:hypothetical protein